MYLFAHRLALQLGEWDVDAMLAAMTDKQLTYWQGYEKLEPWGFPIQERRHVLRGVCAGGKIKHLEYKPPIRQKRRFLTAAEIRRKNQQVQGNG